MKKLIVSVKSPKEVLKGFKSAYRLAKSKKLKAPHYEISLDNKRDFDRFVRNLHVLSDIRTWKPQSVYELAKHCEVDVSNLNKLILFFEEVGAIDLVARVIKGRAVKTPIVPYDEVSFNLAA